MYDNYIAVDWAQRNMAVARMTKSSEKVKAFEGPADVRDLRAYLKGLPGSKVLTIEESTASQWLYTEFKEDVDKLIICDPSRNRLLLEGAKNDKIDSTKTVKLLRAGLLKEVFHSGDDFIYLRKIVSGYEDLIRSGVRLKNQRSSLFRGIGLNHNTDNFPKDHAAEEFVLRRLDQRIKEYEAQKAEFETEFKRLAKKYKAIQNLKSISGIGDIHGVQIAAIVVDARRFPNIGHFLSYCGLIKHEKMSGGKSYGKRASRFCRPLKKAIKMATFSAIQAGSNNPFRKYYELLIHEQTKADHVARHAVSRRIATAVYGVLKSDKKFNPYQFGGNKKNQE